MWLGPRAGEAGVSGVLALATPTAALLPRDLRIPKLRPAACPLAIAPVALPSRDPAVISKAPAGAPRPDPEGLSPLGAQRWPEPAMASDETLVSLRSA